MKPGSGSRRSARPRVRSRSAGRPSGSRPPQRDRVRSVSADQKVAVVTGASSGIGAATVRSLAAAGLMAGAAARRVERCEELAREVGGRAARLDVTDPESVTELVAAVPEVSVLVNNAGGALGLE